MKWINQYTAFAFSLLALAISSCTSLGFQPLPNPYQDAETNAEKAFVTIASFGAAQDTLIEVCGDVQPEEVEAPVCVQLITTEQVLRPAVQAAGRVGAEYADIDARIKALGPDAPAEWLALAAGSAGDLAEAFGPIRQDVEDFIEVTGSLVN